MTETVPEFGDFVLPFQIETLGVRGRVVRLDKTVNGLAGAARYPEDVAVLLASTAALSAALASGLKYEGVFTLQAQGNGPVSILLADMTSDGDMRGYAKFDAEALAGRDDASGLAPRLLGGGHLAFTVDQGPDADRYQGIAELTGATLAECAQTYFRNSEQLETALVLDAQVGADGALRAGAFLIQKMPDEPAGPEVWDDPREPWREATVLASTLKAAELLDPALPAPDMLYRLFHERGVRIFEAKAIRHACRCGRERVANTLASFPEAEVGAMKENGVISVTCEFCGLDYIFDDADLAALYAQDDSPTGDSSNQRG